MSAQKAARVGEEYAPPPRARYDEHQLMDIGTGSGSMQGWPTQLYPYANKCRTRIDKVNAELVVLTYGTIVAQLCKDFDGDYVEVNKQLDKMGYNIGLRLIEDYLAKSNTMKRCSNFRETADMISKVCVHWPRHLSTLPWSDFPRSASRSF